MFTVLVPCENEGLRKRIEQVGKFALDGHDENQTHRFVSPLYLFKFCELRDLERHRNAAEPIWYSAVSWHATESPEREYLLQT